MRYKKSNSKARLLIRMTKNHDEFHRGFLILIG